MSEKNLVLDYIVCPVCNGREFRYRVKQQNYLCRRCGAVFDARRIKNKYHMGLIRERG